MERIFPWYHVWRTPKYKPWFSHQLTSHTCPDRMEPRAFKGSGDAFLLNGAVSINICFYEWKVGRLEKLLPTWYSSLSRWSVPILATPLRAGTNAGSTATHDPQPIRSFISFERVPRPRAIVYQPIHSIPIPTYALHFSAYSQHARDFSFSFSQVDFGIRLIVPSSCCISFRVWSMLEELDVGLG